jgi:hypothetical protein
MRRQVESIDFDHSKTLASMSGPSMTPTMAKDSTVAMATPRRAAGTDSAWIDRRDGCWRAPTIHVKQRAAVKRAGVRAKATPMKPTPMKKVPKTIIHFRPTRSEIQPPTTPGSRLAMVKRRKHQPIDSSPAPR